MPKRDGDAREGLRAYGPATALVLIAFAVTLVYVEPAPPKRVVMATGTAGGAYNALAERYRIFLDQHGITLELRTTAGSVENLGLLESGEVSVALVQGGIVGDTPPAGLHSLGSLFFEPLWLFHRQGLDLDRLTSVAGLRVAIGAEGSGTRALAERLLEENGVSEQVETLPLAGTEAAEALLAGDIDALVMVSSASSTLVRQLVADANVQLASFARADAYERRYRYLSSLKLPEGTFDLAADRPERDVSLLAAAASLVGNDSLHPAVVDLLLQAASAVHGDGGVFAEHGQFPAAKFLDLPLSPDAERFYRYGPPFLQRFMPFWAATLVDRLKVMLLPLLVLMIPLFKIMPPLYQWRMRARIYRWYSELETVDDAVDDSPDAERRAVLIADLDRIEHDLREVRVPLSFANQLYHLRQHLELVRARLRGTPPAS